MGWLARLRHSRGYGVHSPFAYALIMDAIREPAGYDYYAYAELPQARQRLLYRLAAYFDPAGIEACGADAGAALAACPRKAGVRPAAMVIADGKHGAEEPCAALRRGAIVVVTGRGPLAEAVCMQMDALGHGMTFGNGTDMLIAAPLHHLPRQHFEVRM